MTNVVLVIVVFFFIMVAFCMRVYTADKRINACGGYIIVACTAKSLNLERLVKSYYREEVFENRTIARDIIIVIFEDGDNTAVAKRLAQEYSVVHCVTAEKLVDYIRSREINKNQ